MSAQTHCFFNILILKFLNILFYYRATVVGSISHVAEIIFSHILKNNIYINHRHCMLTIELSHIHTLYTSNSLGFLVIVYASSPTCSIYITLCLKLLISPKQAISPHNTDFHYTSFLNLVLYYISFVSYYKT